MIRVGALIVNLLTCHCPTINLLGLIGNLELVYECKSND